MIDFKELPQDGTAFEQLIREILLLRNLNPHWTGKGTDQGRDIIATETLTGEIASYTRTWLVQCKHFAHSGRSVGREDVGGIIDDCRQIKATGYLLACSTQASSSLVTKLRELEENSDYKFVARIWDSVDIEKMLMEPRYFALGHLFFPRSLENTSWKIYNRGEPNKWAAHYKDYFIILTSRIAGDYPDLKDCETIIKRLESIELGAEEYLRPRAIYYDDKHDSYTVYADYLYPIKQKPKFRGEDFNRLLKNGRGLYADEQYEWKLTWWDIEFREVITVSDHFHIDHPEYYSTYMASYEAGMMRAPFWKRTKILDASIEI
jgi:hypothetical protein